MGQIAIFEIQISQYLQTILSSYLGWRFRLGQNSCTHALVPFLPGNSNRAENFLCFAKVSTDFDGANGCSS